MKILDLFCGVGGASMGLHYAIPDAHIVGVDIEPQPQYPFHFVRDDALTVDLSGYDFVWASPPCQLYSRATPHHVRSRYADLIGKVRSRLIASGIPYIIENVEGSPLHRNLWLCGTMFDMRIIRHRHFESSFPIAQPVHPGHFRRVGWGPHDMVTVAGHAANSPSDLWTWQDVMGIDWAVQREQLAEAVPPTYSQYIGDAYVHLYVR